MRTPWNDPVPGMDAIRSVQAVPWYKRILALLLDILLFEFTIARPFVGTSLTNTNEVLVAGVLLLPLFFVYLVGSQYLVRQTLGMMMFNYRVVGDDKLWRYVVRNLFVIPTIPCIVLWVVEPIYYFIKGDRLTEVWSQTSVEVVL